MEDNRAQVAASKGAAAAVSGGAAATSGAQAVSGMAAGILGKAIAAFATALLIAGKTDLGLAGYALAVVAVILAALPLMRSGG
jgi:hypothetical protein